MKIIVLASGSPRRKALLTQIGLPVKVIKSEVEEKLNPRLKARGNAENLSFIKARTVADRYMRMLVFQNTEEEAVILAADTLIAVDDEIIVKPKDEEEARRILRKLSEREHSVITGYTLVDTESGRTFTDSVETKVYFKKISFKDIDRYIKTGECYDAAGAYRIQEKGSIFVERIEGDFYNVVGLPLGAVAEQLKKFDVNSLEY